MGIYPPLFTPRIEIVAECGPETVIVAQLGGQVPTCPYCERAVQLDSRHRCKNCGAYFSDPAGQLCSMRGDQGAGAPRAKHVEWRTYEK